MFHIMLKGHYRGPKGAITKPEAQAAANFGATVEALVERLRKLPGNLLDLSARNKVSEQEVFACASACVEGRA